jgi:hypothetical protein
LKKKKDKLKYIVQKKRGEKDKNKEYKRNKDE